MVRAIIKTTLCVLLLATSVANAVELKPNHPNRYVVKKGDTLWGIANKFLKNPWEWTALWQTNPGIKNPNYIYPGDVLALRTINGELKIIVVNRETQASNSAGAGFSDVIKLSPKKRRISTSSAISTIPIEAIKPFLSRNRLLDDDEYRKAPYVLALSHKERLVAGDHQEIFIRGLKGPEPVFYDIFRKGDEFIDPKTKKSLGYEGQYIARIRVVKYADPATFAVVNIRHDIQVGDRLFAEEPILPPHFTPRPAPQGTTAQIINVDGGVTQIGQYNIVTIDSGSKQGIEPGYVFDIIKHGRWVQDKYSDEPEKVRLPTQAVGELLVFKTYSHISYALIMKATEALTVGEQIRSPLYSEK